MLQRLTMRASMVKGCRAAQRVFVDDGDATVTYSGKRLDELVTECREPSARDVELSVETTVVIPGSSRAISVPSPAHAHRGPCIVRTGNYAPAPPHAAAESDSSYSGPVAFTLSRPVAVEGRSTAGASRAGRALALGSVGILFGLVAATAFARVTLDANGTSARQTHGRERIVEANALFSPMHAKAAAAAPKRQRKSVNGAPRPAGAAPAPGPATEEASAPPIQTAEDVQLLQAARRERPL